MNALILIDIQNDFLPGGALPVPEGNQIIPVINYLVFLPFDHIIATKDWHPPQHGSFADTHNKNPGEKMMLNKIEQTLWPIHCVQGSSGAELSPLWNSNAVHRVFYKGTDKEVDSYSAFFDNGHINSTGLGDYLHSKGVNEVYIAGLATDYCVKYSVLDALTLGFHVHVIADAYRGVDLNQGDSKIALEEMVRAGAKLIQSSEVLEEIKSAVPNVIQKLDLG